MSFTPKHILVPTDGSENAKLALTTAIEIAKTSGADIALLQVVAPVYTTTEPLMQDMPSQMMEQARGYLSRLSKDATASTGFANISTHVIQGAPKPTIAKEFPQEHDIDLIVIGATGTNAFERALLGSTTGYVVRSAAIDVLVVKEPA
ncbi:universal stress protein [Furfurilactobacillus siliginis]|uniref:Universal stress protein n=1 Tax=Furfurilactobacillus siliginis TaxID=348151 RepID=A0A0R2L4W7_9LACO|nr:universal stress protein [Furfurilactobacillus siliginis]KRN96691.1 hypothetical protein IV55_GL001223 [Furfurilactobacillus siliginis]GEK29466.1 universal stress protein UspA [Furfurilactobacillus siliginis]